VPISAIVIRLSTIKPGEYKFITLFLYKRALTFYSVEIEYQVNEVLQ